MGIKVCTSGVIKDVGTIKCNADGAIRTVVEGYNQINGTIKAFLNAPPRKVSFFIEYVDDAGSGAVISVDGVVVYLYESIALEPMTGDFINIQVRQSRAMLSFEGEGFTVFGSNSIQITGRGSALVSVYEV